MPDRHSAIHRSQGLSLRSLTDNELVDIHQATLEILEKTDWNKAKTARLLGMSRATLYSKLLKYGIEDIR